MRCEDASKNGPAIWRGRIFAPPLADSLCTDGMVYILGTRQRVTEKMRPQNCPGVVQSCPRVVLIYPDSSRVAPSCSEMPGVGQSCENKQTHERYMASSTQCPICHIFKFAVAVDGAAAPKGMMTYDSTQGNFLQVSQVSGWSEVCPGGSDGPLGSEVGPGDQRWALGSQR